MTTSLPSHLDPRMSWRGTLTHTDRQERRWTLWRQNLAWFPVSPGTLLYVWTTVFDLGGRTRTTTDTVNLKWAVFIGTTLVCLASGLVELVLALVLWPVWWSVRRLRGKGGAILVFLDGDLVARRDTRDVSVGTLVMAMDQGTIDAMLNLSPDPQPGSMPEEADFSDLLVRPRR